MCCEIESSELRAFMTKVELSVTFQNGQTVSRIVLCFFEWSINAFDFLCQNFVGMQLDKF
jgi:hypothetical protein